MYRSFWRLGSPAPGLVVVISTGLFFGYARQGLLWVPFGLAGVSVAILALLPSCGERGVEKPWSLRFDGTPPKGLRLAVVAVVCLLFGLEFGARCADRHFKATGTTVEGRSTLNRDLPVRLEPLP